MLSLKYDLNSDLKLIKPVMEVKYNNICRAIFDFKRVGLFHIYI